METLLEVKNLKTSFATEEGHFYVVDDISFSLQTGKILGLVGESGCGKSVTSLSILRLIQKPGKIESGQIFFSKNDLLQLTESEMQRIRGNQISMIFQEPMTSLNPVYTCGEQIDEVILLHDKNIKKAAAKEKTIHLLKQVGISAAEKRYSEYPHQLSGGMRQRVMIAMAIACNPKLLIADEPTTALDVTIQAQILELLRNLKTTMILITHDLGIVAENCHDVAIMYAGKIVEIGSVQEIFYRPKHPYTRGLLDSIPHFESGNRKSSLITIPGTVPHFTSLGAGCRFYERCKYKMDQCKKEFPQLKKVNENQSVACFFPLGGNNV